MRSKLIALSAVVMLAFALQVVAQTTGSIAGAVTDSNGAAVPNATIVVTSAAGQEFTATSNESGVFRVPAVASGFYTVSVTAKGFKKSIITNVKVDVGLPSTVDAALEVGAVEQVVEVTSGAEVLQTQTATVGTTITGRQITETPIASRDALDLVALLPGTATVGRPRASSINGLPKGSLAITIDGVDVQDNVLRSSDGYFTYVRPRVDAIEEVTVSTANPGADAAGDGAVSIRFVTKRGTNNYNGGLFWQHRNTALNAAYWFNNRDLKPLPGYTKAPRNVMILNQFGGRYGGKLPFPRFGEGGPYVDSGKDKSYFFVSYEQFRLPDSQTRQRVVLNPDAINGDFKYLVNGVTQTQNLYTLVGAAYPQTPDPTIQTVLNRIRTATGSAGTLTPVPNDPNRSFYNFTPQGMTVRKFLALRFDFNLTKNHSLEFITNQQKFEPAKDFLNGQEERFPGFPAYAQGSSRDSYSTALRSTFGQNIVNEARFAVATGLSEFSPGISPNDFAYSRGFLLDISAASASQTLTTPYSRNSYSNRNTPTYDFTDNVSWLFGNHSFTFGGQIKKIRAESTALNRIVPTVSFGIVNQTGTAEQTLFNLFNNIPNATPTQIAEARSLYATLVGRVSAFTSTIYLGADGKYAENGPISRDASQYTYGLYIQDSWKLKPNFQLNYGVRWQPQTAFTVLSANYNKLSSFDDLWGVSGRGNIFKPGTLTGKVPTAVPVPVGEKAYNDDLNNFAPTVGVVWSPNTSGFLKTILGESGRSAFRGGYSIAYVREGFNLLDSILASNPGGSVSVSRSASAGIFTVGTNLRDPGNPNLSANPFSPSPAYPLTLTANDSANAFDPNVKTGMVHSFSFGYQREIDRNTVVEVRYVGNRGVDLQRQYNINEFNTIENGFAAEFKLAQENLYANLQAGRGATFAYFGAGTNPLPTMLKYFNAAGLATPADALNPARYASANFTNVTLVNALSRLNPNIGAFSGGNFENNATRRLNAIANGLPSNFFYVNPTVPNGAFVVDNSNKTWYDAAVIEVRRRLSTGVRIQANYTFSKAQANAYASSASVFAGFTQRPGGLDLAKNVQAFDLRHNFKFDATWESPFGQGGYLFTGNKLVGAILGGWQLAPTVRWQSGSPISFGNVNLVGMTVKELQKTIGVYKKATVVNYLPDDIILNTQRAFDISVANTLVNGGYGTNFGGVAPTGRYFAPAGTGNCVSEFAGKCGFNNLIVYGPSFFKFDSSLSRKIKFGEKRSVEFRVTALDVLNAPNWRVGGWAADTVGVGLGGGTFGQMANGSAYQDLSTTNDPGGRLLDFTLRINF